MRREEGTMSEKLAKGRKFYVILVYIIYITLVLLLLITSNLVISIVINRRRRRRKCDDLKCVRKPTKSRLSLTHRANKSSR